MDAIEARVDALDKDEAMTHSGLDARTEQAITATRLAICQELIASIGHDGSKLANDIASCLSPTGSIE